MWNAKPAKPAKNSFFLLRRLCALCGLCVPFFAVAHAQTLAARLAILQAEDRRAPTPRDLALIRSGAHSGDEQTVRVAVRALGRLQRPELIPEIAPALRHSVPEIRSEA